MKNKGSRKAIKHAKVMNIDRWKGSPHRAEAPTPQPPRPQTPHFAREVSQKRARGAGAVKLGSHQPPPSLSRLRPSHRTRTTSSTSNQQAHHAAPAGAADFQCLRQLPPPPLCEAGRNTITNSTAIKIGNDCDDGDGGDDADDGHSLFVRCYLGGGGSCRRQGKPAAPVGSAW